MLRGRLVTTIAHSSGSSRNVYSVLKTQRAFTRLELLVVILTVALLVTIGLPALGGSKSRSEQTTCMNNLRLIGRAVHMWGDDHGDRPPWLVPFSDNGLSSLNNVGQPPAWASQVRNVWLHFAWLSNGLATPKILVCPSDMSARVATSFNVASEGGSLHPNYQHRACSYFVGLHSPPEAPLALLSGDRNMQTNFIAACSAFYGMGSFAAMIELAYPNSQWLPGLHGPFGNLLLNDGQVQLTSNDQLNTALRVGNALDMNVGHFLIPQR